MSQKTLDPILVATIQQVALDKVTNNEMFTAFDVSRAVQNMGNRERHMNMKEHVHDVFQTGQMTGYSRTLVAVEPGKPDAYVYHPISADPTQYKPNHQPLPSSLTPQSFYQGASTPAAPSTPSLTSVSFSPPKRLKHQPDARGAISIPASLITKIGAKPGDQLDVNKDGKTLVIATSGSGRKYTVNTSSNIRIKRQTWGSIGDGTGVFQFEEKNGKIIVTHK